jgi:PhoPQ-activated pathogenicity-related protein
MRCGERHAYRPHGPPEKTPLDDSVARPDPTYAGKLANTIPGDGVTSFVLDLTSRTGRAAPGVDRPVWQHRLTVTRPDRVTEAPAAAPADAVDRARRTATVVVPLGQVPNQPLVFNQDGGRRQLRRPARGHGPPGLVRDRGPEPD